MQIRKADNQANITGADESSKTESSVSNKARSSRGIAESESKFETPKANPLFNERTYPSSRSATSNENTAQSSAGANNNSTGTIADGTSNTIFIGEEAAEGSTTPPAQDQQSGVPPIQDGTSNTIFIGEEAAEGSTTPPAQDQQSGVPPIQDGTSNTIFIGEEAAEDSTTPPAQDQQSGVPSNSRWHFQYDIHW